MHGWSIAFPARADNTGITGPTDLIPRETHTTIVCW